MVCQIFEMRVTVTVLFPILWTVHPHGPFINLAWFSAWKLILLLNVHYPLLIICIRAYYLPRPMLIPMDFDKTIPSHFFSSLQDDFSAPGSRYVPLVILSLHIPDKD